MDIKIATVVYILVDIELAVIFGMSTFQVICAEMFGIIVHTQFKDYV